MTQPDDTWSRRLHRDIQILYTRFSTLKLDEEEREWHLNRYFSQLNTSHPDILPTLQKALHERIHQVEGLRDSPEKTNEMNIFQQFLDKAETIIHATSRSQTQ
jgi:hypothetical protein